MNDRISNPYVGPYPFTKEERLLFFGRGSEAEDLLSLVISARLVLFYAQSGAGKTSLLQASLLPDLEKEGFQVLPVARVSGQTQPGEQVDNVFVYNLLRHIDGRDEMALDVEAAEAQGSFVVERDDTWRIRLRRRGCDGPRVPTSLHVGKHHLRDANRA